jgi:hypothetical protein
MTPTTFLIYGKRGSFHFLYTSLRDHHTLWFTPFSGLSAAPTTAKPVELAVLAMRPARRGETCSCDVPGRLLRVCRGNDFIDFVNIPRSEAGDVIVAGKCGEQSIPSQDHVIEVRTARRRTAVGELIDQGPRESEFVVMRSLNSRPRAHRQRGR